MAELILQLLSVFAPIVRDAIQKHQAETGQMPTDAEMRAEFEAHIDAILAEGAAWKATHPRSDPTPPAA